MASNLLPQARLPISEDGTTFSLPWLRFFQGISSGSVDPAVIAALEAEIAAAEAAAATAQATANEALIIAEEAEAGISPAYGITFAALDEPSRPVSSTSQFQFMMGLDGADGADGIGIPGQPGAAGAQGAVGPAGIGIPGQDGEDGQTEYIVLSSTSSSGSSLTVTDGTHTVSGTTQITFSGATVGGSTPNATVAVSGGGSSWTLISTTTITSQTTVTALSAFTGYTDYQIELYNIINTTNADVLFQFGNAAGPTWITSNYYGGQAVGSNIGAQGPAWNPGGAVRIFGNPNTNSPPTPCYALLTVNGPGRASIISVFGTVDYWASASPNGVCGGTVVGRCITTAGPFDSFRVSSTTVFSGTMRIYGR